jgi:hypothetical protein
MTTCHQNHGDRSRKKRRITEAKAKHRHSAAAKVLQSKARGSCGWFTTTMPYNCIGASISGYTRGKAPEVCFGTWSASHRTRTLVSVQQQQCCSAQGQGQHQHPSLSIYLHRLEASSLLSIPHRLHVVCGLACPAQPAKGVASPDPTQHQPLQTRSGLGWCVNPPTCYRI